VSPVTFGKMNWRSTRLINVESPHGQNKADFRIIRCSGGPLRRSGDIGSKGQMGSSSGVVLLSPANLVVKIAWRPQVPKGCRDNVPPPGELDS